MTNKLTDRLKIETFDHARGMLARMNPAKPMSAAELKRWRIGHNLTQAEASDRLGIGRRSLIKYESDAEPVPLYVAKAAVAVSVELAGSL